MIPLPIAILAIPAGSRRDRACHVQSAISTGAESMLTNESSELNQPAGTAPSGEARLTY